MFKGIRALLPPGQSLQCRAVGDALLIQPRGRTDQAAWRFANALARDDQHTVVVVDVPGVAPDTAADAMARALADSPGSLRLVFGSGTPAQIRRAGQRIAEELGTVVVVPDGEVLPTAGGGLYIPGGHGSGWLRLRPGRPFEHDSMGFPKPRWQFSTTDRPWVTSPYAVVEPLPCGVWVRGALPDAADANRRRLFGRLAVDPDVMTVVLGCPGGPAVPLADVVRFWDTVMPTTRSRVRFVHFGPVALPQEGEALGQQLADALEHQVVLYTGMTDAEPSAPADPSTSADLSGAAPDGAEHTGGRSAFVRELLYSPRGTEGAPPPALVGVREPLPGFQPVAPGVYAYAFDAVLEVVQSGLWMRPHAEPDDGDDVRRIAAAPGDRLFLYHRGTPDMAARMRALAEDALWRLGADARGDFVLRPADDPAVDTGAWYAEPIAVSDPHEAVTAAIPPTTRPAGTAPWVPVTVTTLAVGSAVDNVVGEAGEGTPEVAAESVRAATPFQAEAWASAAEELSAPAAASVPAPAARAVSEEPSSPRPASGLTAGLALPDGWVTSTATESVAGAATEPGVAGAATAEASVAGMSGAAAPTGLGAAEVGAPQAAAAPSGTRESVTLPAAGPRDSGTPGTAGISRSAATESGSHASAGAEPASGPLAGGRVEPEAKARPAADPADPEARARPAVDPIAAPPSPEPFPAAPPADNRPSVRRLPLPLAHPVAVFPPSPEPVEPGTTAAVPPAAAGPVPPATQQPAPGAEPPLPAVPHGTSTAVPPKAGGADSRVAPVMPQPAAPWSGAVPASTVPPVPSSPPQPVPGAESAPPAPGRVGPEPSAGGPLGASTGLPMTAGGADSGVPSSRPQPVPGAEPASPAPGRVGSARSAGAPQGASTAVPSRDGGADSGVAPEMPQSVASPVPPAAVGSLGPVPSSAPPSGPPASWPVEPAPSAGAPQGASTAVPSRVGGVDSGVAPVMPQSVAAPVPPAAVGSVSSVPSSASPSGPPASWPVEPEPSAGAPQGTSTAVPPNAGGAEPPVPSSPPQPAPGGPSQVGAAARPGAPTPLPPAAAPAPVPPLAAPRPAGLRLESAGVYPAAAERPSISDVLAPQAPASVPAPPAAQAPAGARVQPVPKGAACAVPPERGIERERDWVRKTFRAQYDVAAGTVARVMSEVPGLRSAGREKASDALIDLVAVRLYLTGNSAGVDESVRSARVGPHVPLARCVASGLRRLPSYRGAALLGAELTDAERAWYRDGRLVTEWSFCAASALPSAQLPAQPRFVIWSMTARRTGLLDAAVPDRVVFLPGTTFKVLRPAGAAGDPVLIREMAATEIGADGRVKPGRSALDDLALESLERAVAELAKAPAGTSAGTPVTASASASATASAKAAAEAGRVPGPQTPPGLMATGSRPRAGARTHAPAQGATHEGATL